MSDNSPPAAQADAEIQISKVWEDACDEINGIEPMKENWKSQALPLARIKKIMKSEELLYAELEPDKPSSRYMIAGEAPLLLGKACEFLIRELTVGAWRHTERNKRRTLQKQDLHAAVGDSDVYDFLIDIIPRIPPGGGDTNPGAASALAHARTSNVDRLRMEEVPALVSSVMPGVGHEAGVNLVNADFRLATLQRMHEQYMESMQSATSGRNETAGAQHSQVQPPMMYAPVPTQPSSHQQAAQGGAVAGAQTR